MKDETITSAFKPTLLGLLRMLVITLKLYNLLPGDSTGVARSPDQFNNSLPLSYAVLESPLEFRDFRRKWFEIHLIWNPKSILFLLYSSLTGSIFHDNKNFTKIKHVK